MATVIVTEYADIARDEAGAAIAAGVEPSIAVQTVTYTTSTQMGAALNSRTRFVRIHTVNALAHLKFSVDGTAATAADTQMPANAIEYFGLTKRHGSSMNIAFYDGSS